jgi:serine/threonine protein phosphatase PrpC
VINVFEIDNNTEGILLGTDGLWDELDNQGVNEIYQ